MSLFRDEVLRSFRRYTRSQRDLEALEHCIDEENSGRVSDADWLKLREATEKRDRAYDACQRALKLYVCYAGASQMSIDDLLVEDEKK